MRPAVSQLAQHCHSCGALRAGLQSGAASVAARADSPGRNLRYSIASEKRFCFSFFPLVPALSRPAGAHCDDVWGSTGGDARDGPRRRIRHRDRQRVGAGNRHGRCQPQLRRRAPATRRRCLCNRGARQDGAAVQTLRDVTKFAAGCWQPLPVPGAGVCRLKVQKARWIVSLPRRCRR